MKIIAALLCFFAFLPLQAQVSRELLKKSREAQKQMEKVMEANPHREYPKIEKATNQLDSLLPQILRMGNHQQLPLDSLLGDKKYLYVSGTSDGRISAITYYTNNGGSYHMMTSWARIEHPDGSVDIQGPYDFFPDKWENAAPGVYIGTGLLHTCNSCHSDKVEIWKNNQAAGRLQPSRSFENPYRKTIDEGFTMDSRMGNMIKAFEWSPDSQLVTLEFLSDDLTYFSEDPQVQEHCIIRWKYENGTFRLRDWEVPGFQRPEEFELDSNDK